MAKLPDAQALGERPVPSPRGGIISGPSNAGLPEAIQARDATKGVVEFADQLAQAGERIYRREDYIKSSLALDEFRKKSDDLKRDYLANRNLADPDSAKNFTTEIEAIENSVLSGL